MSDNMNNEIISLDGDFKNEVQAPVQSNTDLPFENNYNLQEMLATAGTLKTTKEQQKIIFAPVKEDDIEVRPDGDGVLYLPWYWYSDRLSKAFPMAWTIVPQGMPKTSNDLILWGFSLIIEGVFCGFVIGEGRYRANNKTMTYGDVIESTRSNALMRLCKGIGMGHELWDKDFVKKWMKKYAVRGTDKNGNPIWIKRVVDPVVEVKNKWIEAALVNGIMKNKDDLAGRDELKMVLLETYTDITVDNADKYLEIGLKKIEGYKVS